MTEVWTPVNGLPCDKQVCDDCGQALLATRYTLVKYPTVRTCSALCAVFLYYFPEGVDHAVARR